MRSARLTDTTRPSSFGLASDACLLAVVTFFLSVSAFAQPSDFPPVTDAMLESPAPGDWLMWRRTQDSWGFSPLSEIDRSNVRKLGLVWTRPLAEGTSDITPLAYGGMLFVPQVSDIIEAFDAATGDRHWRYERELPESIYARVGFNARNNRNLAIYGRTIINTSDDNFIFALDALTGETVWETKILDYETQSATHSSGPIVAGGLAISGRSCRPWGGPDACIITAHDAKTGDEAWRRRLIPAPGEPGDETWGDVAYEDRQHVGSWMVPSYDPELGLVFAGTSVTSPAPKFLLGGTDKSHLYHNSTLALDIETGEIRWYYQHLNDSWDLDHPFERILVETRVAPDPDEVAWINPSLTPGETRKVVTGIPGKTGIVYTLDRATGEFLWANPTVPQNVIQDIDGRTGAPRINREIVFEEIEQEVHVCPTWTGGKNWEAGSYNPINNTMYFPLRNTCATMLATRNFESRRARALTKGGQAGLEIYSLAARHELAPGVEHQGTVRAIDASTGETRWLHEQEAWTLSLVATAGGLVFGGDGYGRFRAFDDDTGEILWEVNLGSAVVGYPISFAVGGRQYIAVATGSGAPDVVKKVQVPRGSSLFVFALPR